MDEDKLLSNDEYDQLNIHFFHVRCGSATLGINHQIGGTAMMRLWRITPVGNFVSGQGTNHSTRDITEIPSKLQGLCHILAICSPYS